MAIQLKNHWLAVSNTHRELTIRGGNEVSHGVVLECGDSVGSVDVGDTVVYETDSLIHYMDGDHSMSIIHESSVILVVTQ